MELRFGYQYAFDNLDTPQRSLVVNVCESISIYIHIYSKPNAGFKFIQLNDHIPIFYMIYCLLLQISNANNEHFSNVNLLLSICNLNEEIDSRQT